MYGFKQNISFALRTLFKNKGFTITAVLTLALGIGATTAIFSVVYAVFEPMPHPKPDELVMVWAKTPGGRSSVPTADFLEWRRRSTSFQDMNAWTGASFNVATADRPEQISGARCTPGFFAMRGLQATRLDLNEILQLGGRSGSRGIKRNAFRALIVAEFSLALTLLATGGLALRGFWNLNRIDLGIQTDNVLTFRLPVPDRRLNGPDQIRSYYGQMLEKIQTLPGVAKAALTTGVPGRGAGNGTRFTIVGQPVNPEARLGTAVRMVTPELVDTLGIRMVSGRNISEHDTPNTVRVATVNEHFVKQYLPGALHKKSKQSAKGAEYESQGQARSEAERGAPGERKRSDPALKARNTRDISAFQALFDRAYRNQGRRGGGLAGPLPPEGI
jgi:hypothetical protein